MTRRHLPPIYAVKIERHTVPPRWLVACQATKLPAVDELGARLTAVRRAHSAAGVPPWKPCVESH